MMSTTRQRDFISMNVFRHAMKCAAVCLATAVLAACEDTTFDNLKGPADSPVFEVSLASSWSAGTPVKRSEDTGITIKTLKKGELYLVTEEHELNDSVMTVSDMKSRGAQVNTKDDFPDYFGLTAFCYTGNIDEFEENDITANFANNLKMSKSGVMVNEDGTPSDRKLDWPGSGNIRFYAYAPYYNPGDATNKELSHADNSPHISFTVNTDVKKQTDLLTAVATCKGDGTGDDIISGSGAVNLSFGHALSAITFKAGDAMLAGTITKIKLSGVYGSGSTLIGSDKWTTTGRADATYEVATEIIIAGGGSGDTPDGENPYVKPGTPIAGTSSDELTMFMIPQTLGPDAKIEITITEKLTGKSYTLTAGIGSSDGSRKWLPGKLYAYSLSSTGMILTPVFNMKHKGKEFTEKTDTFPFSGFLTDVEFESYVKVVQADKEETVVKQPLSNITYKVGDETTFKPVTYDKDTKELLLPPQPVFEELRDKFGTQITEAGKGTSGNPFDLSGGGETANCYMIHDHGYYKLPLIYGNARNSAGATNTASYTVKKPGMISDNPIYHRPSIQYFVDHANRKIEHMDIPTQTGGVTDAVLLWQDVPGMVSDVKLSNDKKFLTFKVNRHALNQGNAVVAVRKDGVIVWSWHIWATYQKWEQGDLIKTTARKKNSGDTQLTDGDDYYLTPCNLGYSDRHGKSPKRKIVLRCEFDLKVPGAGSQAKKISKDITFWQSEILASLGGDNTYYQWGRKDPMLPGIYDKIDPQHAGDDYYTANAYYQSESGEKLSGDFTMLNKPFFVDDEQYRFGKGDNPDGASFGESIRFPYVFFMGNNHSNTGYNYRAYWHNGHGFGYWNNDDKCVYYHAWNSNSSGLGSSSSFDNVANYETVTKTIYDPCPPGYCVPPVAAFTGMLGANRPSYGIDGFPDGNKPQWDESTACWRLNSKYDGTGSPIFFPATGVRDMNVRMKANSTVPSTKLPLALKGQTWCSFRMIAYITTSVLGGGLSAVKDDKDNVLGYEINGPKFPTDGSDGSTKPQNMIFYLDNRYAPTAGPMASSNASYGFSVRPAKIQ